MTISIYACFCMEVILCRNNTKHTHTKMHACVCITKQKVTVLGEAVKLRPGNTLNTQKVPLTQSGAGTETKSSPYYLRRHRLREKSGKRENPYCAAGKSVHSRQRCPSNPTEAGRRDERKYLLRAIQEQKEGHLSKESGEGATCRKPKLSRDGWSEGCEGCEGESVQE